MIANPEDRFSHDEAHMLVSFYSEAVVHDGLKFLASLKVHLRDCTRNVNILPCSSY